LNRILETNTFLEVKRAWQKQVNKQREPQVRVSWSQQMFVQFWQIQKDQRRGGTTERADERQTLKLIPGTWSPFFWLNFLLASIPQLVSHCQKPMKSTTCPALHQASQKETDETCDVLTRTQHEQTNLNDQFGFCL
jgi:hypothetical protein